MMSTAQVLVTQSCLTLLDLVDYSPPGSLWDSVHGIHQVRGMGLSFPSPGDLPNPGIEPGSSGLQADSLPSEPPGKPHDEHNQQLLLYLVF